MDACDTINTRLAALKAKNPTAPWGELVSLAALESVDLVAEG